MTGNYWIKLFIEILDDSKMATLPDRLWRRVIELFLLAGRYYKDGKLPDTNELSWALRMSMDDLDLDLKQIAQIGIINKTDKGWLVVNFAKRQAKMTDAERAQAYRDRQHLKQYYGNEPVTLSDACVTQITDNRSDTEADIKRDEKSATAAVFTKYQSGIGLITPGVAEKIKLALDEYPEDWIIKSIDEAETHNARNWKYCEAILKRWKVEGIENGKSKDEHAGLVSYKGEWRDPRNIPTEEY
jgi:DnaD/phage-associated family protein